MSFLFRPVVHAQDSSLNIWNFFFKGKLSFYNFQVNETQHICRSGFSVGCPWMQILKLSHSETCFPCFPRRMNSIAICYSWALQIYTDVFLLSQLSLCVQGSDLTRSVGFPVPRTFKQHFWYIWDNGSDGDVPHFTLALCVCARMWYAWVQALINHSLWIRRAFKPLAIYTLSGQARKLD